MMLTMLKSKLHRAKVTCADLHYEGSIGIPTDLMETAGLIAFEQVDVLNVNNGERFTTYVIELPANSRQITINGPAARKAQPGDIVIICAYAQYSEQEAKAHQPKVFLMDADNQIKSSTSH
jgi:aspartate 1-decarboxylase